MADGPQAGRPLPHEIALIQQPKQAQSQKLQQRLIMSDHMQQALNVLQSPVLELAELIQAEMEANPVLEYSDPEEGDWTLDAEAEEANLDEDRAENQELEFSDHDFDVLRQLDEEFRDHFLESRNYALQRSNEEKEQKMFQEQQITSQPSLYEHLMAQAREVLEDQEQQHLAELIIGNLDESGFLGISLAEIALLEGVKEASLVEVLEVLQQCDPQGICARNLQECLMIQLRVMGKQHSLAYRIVKDFYEELIHNKTPAIQRKLGSEVERINEAIFKDIAGLDLHPAGSYGKHFVQAIAPDVTITNDGGTLEFHLGDEEYMPTFRYNSRYLKLFGDESTAKETKDFIRSKMLSAKWLLRNIHHRGSTLSRITELLIKYQASFLSGPEGHLLPLTMKSFAEELDLHESTIARAVANKYIDTPRGLLPMRFFFSSIITTQSGTELSNKTVQGLVKQIIEEENKLQPLSDLEISKKLSKRGIDCARRTVAKYRTLLGIGNTHQRKHHC